MSAQPVLSITGTVHSVREVTWPERHNSETGRVTAAGSYQELTLVTEASYLGGGLSDVPATIAIRVNDDIVSEFSKGDVVSCYVTTLSQLQGRPGSFYNVVAYRYAGRVPVLASSGSPV